MSSDLGLKALVCQRIDSELFGDDKTHGLVNNIAGLGPAGILKDYAAYYAACARVNALMTCKAIIETAYNDLYNPPSASTPGKKVY